jgi:DNA-binding MarR family transcriptional regulator
MSQRRRERAYEIIWLIRRTFRAMGVKADEYLADADLSVADRAVLEFLHPQLELSVPEIARRYDVSRQHVQVTVNALVTKGLLRSVENPKHKRSRLMRLSGLGRDTFEEIRRNESAVVDRIFRDVPDDALETTHETLKALLQNLR